MCLKLVVMVMMNPGFPQHFTDMFQLLPISLFKVDSTHNFHGDQCFMMADFGLGINDCDDLLIVLKGVAVAMNRTEGSKGIECLDCQIMLLAKMLPICHKKFLVNRNHLVPMFVLFVEFYENGVCFC